MERFEQTAAIRAWSRAERVAGRTIAFVPTMGALHAGHLSLVDLAAERADRVVVSIFLNPTQFGPDEDLDRYPRDLQGDLDQLAQGPVDTVWIPTADEIYPPGYSTWVTEETVAAGLEGRIRPGHFRGVTTVVTRLLIAVEPDLLVLGEKDAQQAAVLTRLVRDLGFAVEVLVGPTVRSADGLALSSRNAYLSPAERKQAVCLSDALRSARELVNAGQRDAAALVAALRERIEREPDARIDYLAVVEPDSFQPLDRLETSARICLAVRIGTTRLIDNELVHRES